MVSIVSSSPTGGNFIFCTKMTEMSDLCYLQNLEKELLAIAMQKMV